ncbi:MAG: hypothetical protein KAH57_00245 [Thermoplasmata archaeon]|nr:hypothetical protein [Thermoplasmata archaeon]
MRLLALLSFFILFSTPLLISEGHSSKDAIRSDASLFTNAGIFASDSNLTGEWLFDDGAGGLASDTSGFSNNGTLTYMNANTDWVEGINGTALEFDGTNDHVSVPWSSAFDTDSGTITAWVQTTTTGSQVVFSEGKKTASDPYYMLSVENGQAGIYRDNKQGHASGTIPVNDGKWHFIAWTQNGTPGGLKVYIDGVEDTLVWTAGADDGGWFDDCSGDTFAIGILDRSTDWGPFNGILDEARIWNCSLTSQEIGDLYNTTWAEYLSHHIFINNTSLPTAFVNESYSTQLDAYGGTGTLNWTIDLGSLPSGLQLFSNGAINGTTTQEGTFSMVVNASDGYGTWATQSLILSSIKGFGDGNGSTGSPYIIETIRQLQNMSVILDANYILGKDIDASATRIWNSGAGFDPIGDSISAFTGSLDGNGFEISNFYINRPNEKYVGLFGHLGSGSDVRDLGITGSLTQVVGYNYVGGFAGLNDGGSITNCYYSGQTIGVHYLGGFIGLSIDGSINNCFRSGFTRGGNNIGGFVGRSLGGSFDNCYSTGDVQGGETCGGFTGYNTADITNSFSTCNAIGRDQTGGFAGTSGGTLINCYSTGSVKGTWDNVGGFAGYNSGTIINSHSTGKANGGLSTGGFAGYNKGTIQNCYGRGSASGGFHVGGFVGWNDKGSIENCYSTGPSIGEWDFIGGFAGINEGSIMNCYSTGSARGDHQVGGFAGMIFKATIMNCYSTGSVRGGDMDVGGFIGRDGGYTLTASFWDTVKSGMTTSAGGLGRTTAQMKQQATFTNWDFTTTWDIIQGSTYPYLTTLRPVIHTSFPNLMEEAFEESPYFLSFDALAQPIPSFNTIEIWNMSTDASEWLSMNFSTGAISGFPSNEDVGIYFVNVSVEDTIGSIQNFNFTLTVTNVNDPPVLTTSDIPTATEDEFYSVDYNAYDIDLIGDILTWEFSTEAEWLSIDPATGWLNGTPGNNDVGSAIVNVTVSDGNGGYDSSLFTLNVENVNDLPVITTLPQDVSPEDAEYSISFTADDEDPVETVYTWTLDTNAGWLDMTGNHLFGTPDNDDVGTYWVNVSVSDGYGGSDSINYTLSITNINDAPFFTGDPVTTAVEDELYTLILEYGDMDAGDDLALILISNPDWLNLDGSKLEGVPENEDVGSSWVKVIVTDSAGANDTLGFLLTVSNSNDAPEWSIVPSDEVLTEGDILFLDCMATDEDDDDLMYSIESTPMTEISIDPSTGRITSSAMAVGLYDIIITVTDEVVSIDHSFTVTVEALPDEPDDNITVTDETTDTDGDGMPDWWESFYGLDPNNSIDASGDLDNDNITNLDEFLGRTSPLKEDSLPVSDDDEDAADEKGDWDMNNLAFVLIILLIISFILLLVNWRKKEDPARLMTLVSLFILLSTPLMISEGYSSEEAISLNVPSFGYAGSPISGGNGTAGNPYLISNITQLQNMSANLSAHYMLVEDIDASLTSGWNYGDGFDPIGYNGARFTGSLDGNGHEISDLHVDRPGEDHVGLFGYLSSGSVVKDLGLTGSASKFLGRDFVGGVMGRNDGGSIENCYSTVDSTGTDDAVGSFGGYNAGSITNCFSTGSAEGIDNQIGGFVGYNTGTIANCYSTGSATGADDIGGFAGYNTGNIENCYSTGYSIGAFQVGGFIGRIASGSITNCYSTGSATGTWNDIGGFAGECRGTITQCHSRGSARGNLYVGGFIGNIFEGTIKHCYSSGHADVNLDFYGAINSNIGGFAGYSYQSTIEYCYSTGSAGWGLGTDDYVGGFIGYLYQGEIRNSYSTGNAKSRGGTYDELGGFVGYNYWGTMRHCYSTGIVDGILGAGGFVGTSYGSLYNCYWDTTRSGMTSSGGGIGRTTAQMKQQATFGNWNFDTPWGIVEDSTYPYLNNIEPVISTAYIASIDHVMEDSLYLIPFDSIAQSHPGFNQIERWNLTTNGTGWLSINSTTGMLSGTPSNEDTGIMFVNVSVNDTVGSIKLFNYTLTVANVNDDPMITTDDVLTAPEDQYYSVDYNANDIDPTLDEMTWDLSSDADWLSIDPVTGWLNGTPENNDVGIYDMILTVSDGNGGEDTISFILNITNVNDPPVITTLPQTGSLEDAEYSVMFTAEDEDPVETVYAWTLDTNAGWLSIDPATGLLSGRPTNDDVGTFLVNVSVSDGYGGSDSINFSLRILDINDAPFFTCDPITTAVEDEQYNMTLEVQDVDAVYDLTPSLISSPDWLVLNGWKLEGMPTNNNVGSSWVEIMVTDSAGANDTLGFLLTVFNSNDAPVWSVVPSDQIITEGDDLFVKCMATDEDDDTIVYLIGSTPASNILIDASTGSIRSVSPVAGVFTIKLTATDGVVPIEYSFTITVNALPDEPDDSVTVSDENTDTDGDSMPDWWESFYGLDPNNSVDASGDLDNDNITNLDEFLVRTSPLKDDSMPISDDDNDEDVVDEKGDWNVNKLVFLLIVLLIASLILLVVVERKKAAMSEESIEE